jgi:hypothetical protein
MPESPFSPPIASANSTPSKSEPDLLEALKADLLTVYRAVIALERRVNESTVNIAEVKPHLIALKVHTESFPNALREIRRSQVATQKLVAQFDARLRTLETHANVTGASSAVELSPPIQL